MSFIPAAGLKVLTPAYDRLLRVFGLGAAFRDETLRQFEAKPGQRILDLGCGTGTLLVQLKQRCPDVQAVGIDIDEEVLAIAKKKAKEANTEIELKKQGAEQTAEPAESFHRVVSSLVIHHLETAAKVNAIKEAFRVLRPGGTFLLVDFGPVPGVIGAVLGRILARNYFEESGDNYAGRLPRMLEEAGFEGVRTRQVYKRFVHFIEGRKPSR